MKKRSFVNEQFTINNEQYGGFQRQIVATSMMAEIWNMFLQTACYFQLYQKRFSLSLKQLICNWI